MLSFVYTAEYDDEAFKNEEGYEADNFNVHVHKVADKYNMPQLKQLACSKLRQRAESDWKSPAFAAAIVEIYSAPSSTTSKLKDIVLDICHKNAKVLLARDGAIMIQTARDLPSFGTDLLVLQVRKGPHGEPERTLLCPERNREFTIRKLLDDKAKYTCPHCLGKTEWNGWSRHVEVT